MAENDHSPRDFTVRAAALAVAVAVQAPLLWLGYSREPPPLHTDTMIVRFVADETLARRSQPETAELASDTASPLAAPSAPLEDRPSVSAPPAPSPPDWRRSGALSARSSVDAIIRDEGYRALGPRKPPSFREPAPPPSIHEAPKHSFGDAEMDPLNRDVVWLSENCYFEFGKFITPRVTADIGNVVIPKCRLSGGKEPRGDLFDHLKRDKGAQEAR